MQRIDGQTVWSATDLVGYLACEHLAHLEAAALAGLAKRPFREDPELDAIARRGLEHEKRFLAALRAEGRRVTEMANDGWGARSGTALRAAVEDLAAALHRGDDVVYQATLFDGRWRGHADFLVRVEVPSALGPWSYEVYDTKLARQATAGAVLQLSLYSELLAAVQGVTPTWMHVVLGGSLRRVEAHRVASYAAYYRLVKQRFEALPIHGAPCFPPPTRPDPVEHCEVCRWSGECRAHLRRVDDLSLVAGITAQQRRDLRERDVTTRQALALLPPAERGAAAGTKDAALARVREQARIQVEGERAGRTLYELLEPPRTRAGELEPALGLAGLPAPSPGDLFFDMEGDPFALEDGVDFLFGIVDPGCPDAASEPAFHRFWSWDDGGAISLAGERRAFEQTVDFFIARLERDPHLHIYHYAPYERTALSRLMGRHATREDAVDRLLRGGVLVDLYRVVRQSLRASVESYSIKCLEPLYGFERAVDLRDAGASLATFSAWLDEGGRPDGDPAIREHVEAYNRDDCRSNWRLRDWLEERRRELAERLGGTPLARPARPEPSPSPALTEYLERVRAAEERLTAGFDPAAAGPASVEKDEKDETAVGAEAGVAGDCDAARARWLLAQLLSWHRREDKAAWWRWFFLVGLSDEERIEEPEPIGGLVYEGVVATVARSLVHRYRFPPQEHEVSPGRPVKDPATGKSIEVVAVDTAAGTLDLKRGRTSAEPHPTSVIPELLVKAQEQKDSLLRVAEWVIEHGLQSEQNEQGDGRYGAARDLLLRRPPRAGQAAGSVLAGDEPAAVAARRLGLALDRGCLAIQGPPGSGKTTTGTEMIVDLVAAGRQVGVTANSHKVIGNLLDKVALAAAARKLTLRLGQKPGAGESCTCAGAQSFGTNESLLRALRERAIDVAGGTAWMWAREDFGAAVDTLFVDEAGQMSLANTVAVAPSARNLVLLGDPQQLDQPLRGSHPPGAEKSALAHLLGGALTMPPELGLFLERTWRLHPAICDFTSSAFYDDRLAPEAGRDRQQVRGAGPLDGAGLRYLPVPHAGNGKESSEEAALIARIVGALLAAAGTWSDSKGLSRPLGMGDVLVITPYNAQVKTISEALPDALVGTVDKFQGQEAPIAIYSMATSTAQDAPRGMEFLYSLHRLNVATSRGCCLAVVVASPDLARVRCRTPRQMRLANALCRVIEMGTPWP